MSEVISATTGRRYGIERVCRTWDVPRSTFYAKRASATTPSVERRGPRPLISDSELLEAIRADLQRSPFQNEGYRKVWARLRVIDRVRVARKRVLRIMRENSLLSPHRSPSGEPKLHDGRIPPVETISSVEDG